MNASSARAPTVSGGRQTDARAALDQLERSVADALVRLKPGARSSVAVHEEIHRLVLTNAVRTALSSQVSSTAIEQMVKQLGRNRLIDEALQKSTQAYADALGKLGLTPSVLELLQSWMEVTMDVHAYSG